MSQAESRVKNPSSFYIVLCYLLGTFYANMGTIKDRNGMGLTETEDIKKKWQEHTEKLYKRIFKIQIITMV